MSCNQSILNKKETSLPFYLFDQLHKYFTVLYDCLVITIIHTLVFTFLLFPITNNGPVSFKTVLKFVDNFLLKLEYGLKMCTEKMYTKRVLKYTKTWIYQHIFFLY